jgi:hypothetical protein
MVKLLFVLIFLKILKVNLVEQATFSIGLNQKDSAILYQIRATMGVGEISKSQQDDSVRYTVSSISGLAAIINPPPFNNSETGGLPSL